ncbi:MAG: MFS transporter [Phycisphaerales bacterium]
MYDLANQSFQLLVNTLLFGIYVTNVVATDPKSGKGLWTLMIGVSMLAVVVLSPIVGAIADERACKKRMLIGGGLVAVVLTSMLALLGPGMAWQAFALYVVAAVMVGLGENLLGAFLPSLSTPGTVGRVSAIGWTMSYAGALMLLGITSVVVFGLGITDPAQWRWLFVLSGVWFLAGMLPAVFILRERRGRGGGRSARSHPPIREIVGRSLGRLRDTLRQAARYRQLTRFMFAFFVYSLGTYTVIFYAGLIGDGFGFGIGQLTLLALVMAGCAGASSVGTAWVQDRLGHRRTIGVFLVIWVASTLALAAMARRFAIDGPSPEVQRYFWLISAGIGFGLGGVGTASRAMVGAFTPKDKSGEFFGVWGMVFKLAGVAGPVAFGQASRYFGQPVSLLVLCGFFAAGLALLMRVDEGEGRAGARGSGVAQ